MVGKILLSRREILDNTNPPTRLNLHNAINQLKTHETDSTV